MTTLNEADEIYLGNQAVNAVYLGTNKLWSLSVPQSAFTTQIPNATVTGVAPIAIGHDFQFATAGRIVGFRYWRNPDEPASNRLFQIWTSPQQFSGTLAASMTSPVQSGGGWKTVNLPAPFSITAGQIVRVVAGCSVEPLDRLSPRPPGVITNGDVTLRRPWSDLGTYFSQASLDAYPTAESGSLYFIDVLFEGGS